MQKKNSILVLAPPPPRSRSELNPMSAPPQSYVNNEQESNGLPNLEPTLNREETFS